MKITGIELKNVKSFMVLPKTDLSSSINIFIGENNSGKSTLLSAIHLIQKPDALSKQDQTVGTKNGLVKVYASGNHVSFNEDEKRLGFSFNLRSGNRLFLYPNDGEAAWGGQAGQSEPNNLIYPYLSKRKVASYSHDVHKAAANTVSGNFTNLYAKIDRLSDPEASWYKDYVNACDEILGFRISTSGGEGSGKHAVYKLGGFEEISMTSMGEGVPNLLGLIADLCVAENNIFLIEEPENDIHPKALKALLNFIIKKSGANQFFISTHSNIVMRVLGAIEDSKVFEVSSKLVNNSDRPKLFLSSVKEITTQEERRAALENLGYEFFDYGHYAGYLFLEEASAELIIREYLIPWFLPDLGKKIKTYSAASSSKIEKRFEDFNNLFVFTHLEPLYKNKAWVIIDGGENESKIIEKLKSIYVEKNGWSVANFTQFTAHDFEEYYPSNFKEKFITQIKNNDSLTKEERRTAKSQLLIQVIDWIRDNTLEAKTSFETSAKEVIDKLDEISTCLKEG